MLGFTGNSKVVKFTCSIYFTAILILEQRSAIATDLCNNSQMLGAVPLPEAFVYNASDYDANIGTKPNLDTNGTITFKTDGSEIVQLGLECRHNRPIKWVFEGDYVEDKFEEIHNFISRDINGDFESPEKYQFLARYEFKFSSFEKSPVFICQTIDDHCNRRVVVTKRHQSAEEITFYLISNNDTFLVPEVVEFEQKLLSSFNPQKSQKCLANVTFGDDDESIYVELDPVQDYITFKTILDPQSYENYYRFVPQEDKECFNKIEPQDLACEGTQEGCKFLKHDGSPVGFYYVIGDERRIFKGFWDLNIDYTFHLEPDKNLLPQDLIHIDTPSEVYIGQNLEIKCFSSQIYFAHGTLIALSLVEGESPKFLNQTSENEFEFEGGGRITTGYIFMGKTIVNEISMNFPEVITVSCYAPIWNSVSWTIRSETISVLDSEQPAVRITSFISSSNSFICEGFGTPLPELEIIYPKQNFNFTQTKNYTNSSVTLTLSLPSLDTKFEGVYNCVATSVVGTNYTIYELTIPTRGLSSFVKIVILTLSSGLIISLLLIFGAWVKLKADKVEYKRKTKEAIREFEKGFRDDQSMCSLVGLDYDRDRYEVPLKMWDLDGTLLGSGAYGKVHKGYVQTEEGRKLVAIKIVNSPSNVDDFRTTLIELTVMSYMGTHENIVSLIAACVENIDDASLLLGVEYCVNGCLEDYLRKHRPLFHNFVKDGKLSLEDLSSHGPYANILASANFSTLDLYKWSFQIASGMDFLETKKVLHADLAARNVLLTQDKIAKISDFGLSRTLTKSEEYKKTTFVQLPWKWMAPESLRNMQFSSKSDVWSYGVTLWEIFSLGSEPWPYETWTMDYMEQLETGRRLPRPCYCTTNTYNAVMTECWKFEPADRIKFASARMFFEKVIIHLSSRSNTSTVVLNMC